MMRSRRLLGSVVLLFSVLLLALPARGQEVDPLKLHHNRGSQLFREAHYAAALSEFQEAYKVRPLPRLLLLIGQAQLRLGNGKAALRFYKLFQKAERRPNKEVKALLKQEIKLAQAVLKGKHPAFPQPAPEASLPPPPAAAPATPAPAEPAEVSAQPAPAAPAKPPPAPASAGAEPPPNINLDLPSTAETDETAAARRAAHTTAAPKPAPATPLVLRDARAPEPRRSAPFYKKWWFWTAVGAVTVGVVAGIAVAAAPGAPAGAPEGVTPVKVNWMPSP